MRKKRDEREETQDVSGSRAVIKFRISDLIIVLFLTVLCLTCILPFMHIAAKSLSSESAVLANDVFLWPVHFTTQAYASIFRDGQLVRSMLYSVGVTAVFTVLGLFLTICAAFALSQKRMKGRYILTFIIMLTMYFSAGLIPEYLLLHELNLLNNTWVLILPLCFAPSNFLIMKTYFRTTIPESLYEAAYLDGATDFQVLFRVVLPLSKAILATISLFLAIGRWNSYSDSMYYITDRSKQMIQYLLYSMIMASGQVSINDPTITKALNQEVLQSASVMFVTVPVLCIYPFVQKYFVKGVMIGSVKG